MSCSYKRKSEMNHFFQPLEKLICLGCFSLTHNPNRGTLTGPFKVAILSSMKTMTVSDFKNHALQTINRVNTEHQMIVITKWGNPIAELRPFQNKTEHPVPGKLAAALIDEQDIVTPFGEELWNAGQ